MVSQLSKNYFKARFLLADFNNIHELMFKKIMLIMIIMMLDTNDEKRLLMCLWRYL